MDTLNHLGEKKTHHGQVLEKAARRSNISLTELSKKTGVTRRTLYNWFLQEKLSNAILSKVGNALNFDFSVEIPEYQQPIPVVIQAQLKTPATLTDLKQKYIDLLEKYNDLICHINKHAVNSFEGDNFSLFPINNQDNYKNITL